MNPHTDPPVQFTDSFKCLGNFIDWQLTCEQDIAHRPDQARKAFWKLTSHVWDVRQLTLHTKLRVYRACVLSVLLYGSETWTITYPLMRKLKAFHMLCLRKICGVTRWMQQTRSITNERILALGVPSIDNILHQNRLRWMGHVARQRIGCLSKPCSHFCLQTLVNTHM